MTGLQQGTEETHLFGDDMCSCQYLVVFDSRRPALTSLAPWPWPSLGPDSGEPWLAWPCSLILPLKVAPASGLRPGFESRPHVLGLCGQGQAAHLLRASVCPSVNEDHASASLVRSSGRARAHLQSALSHGTQLGLFTADNGRAGGPRHKVYSCLSVPTGLQHHFKTSKRPSRNFSTNQPETLAPQEPAFPKLKSKSKLGRKSN